jgi:hypothetical protein
MDIDQEEPKEKQLRELKAILAKQHGREFTDQEVRQAFWDMKKLAHILYKVSCADIARKELLKENPKGFHLEEGGTCLICKEFAPKENSWFDQNGVKCMFCQKALDEKIIPASVIEKRDSWYSKRDLERYFNIKGVDLNKCIKNGLLKDRVVMNDKKKVHFQLFLMKDNKGVLPPKKILESKTITIIHKEKEYLTQEEWYETGDMKVVKRLAKYQIIHCLKETLQKPMTGGRFLVPKGGVNPLFSHK